MSEKSSSEVSRIKEKLISGYISFIQGDITEALKIFSDLHSRFPDNMLITYNYVITLIRTGNIEKASKVLESFIARKKSLGVRLKIPKSIMNLILTVELLKKNIDEVLDILTEYFAEEIYISPPDWEIIPSLTVNILDIFRADDEDLSKLQRWLSQRKNEDIILPLNKSLREMLYRAIKSYTEEIHESFTPLKISQIYSILSITALSLNVISEAKKAIEKAINIDRNPLVLNMYGKVYYVIGDLNTAISAFKEALIIDHENSFRYITLTNIGNVFARIGDYDLAIELITKALKIKADCFVCWYSRAIALLRSEKWKEAENSFKALIQMRRDDPRIWYGLGQVYLARGKILESIECFLKAMKLNPDDEIIQLHIELARYLAGRRGEGK